jgi:hypothetical protein
VGRGEYIMNIKSLEREKFRTVTVELVYDEIRCICNSLYELSKNPYMKKEQNFDDVYKSFIELFALIKHGCIPDFELKNMYDLLPHTKDKKESCLINE